MTTDYTALRDKCSQNARRIQRMIDSGMPL
jgi:hypothetical protein